MTPFNKALVRWVIGGAGVFLIFWLLARVQPSTFDLHFSWYAVPSLIGLATNGTLLFLMSRLPTKNKVTTWFSFFLLTLLLWAIFQSLQQLSIHPEGALTWSLLASGGWVLLPVTFYLFSVVYLNKDDLNEQTSVLLFLTVSALFFLYLNFNTDALIPHTVAELTLQKWGYNSAVRAYFPIFIIWFEALFIIPLVWMIKRYRVTQGAQRQQLNLFIIAIAIPLIGGSLTDGVLPIFGITLYPAAMLLTSIMAILVAYGMFFHGLFVFNPATVATNILQTMQEAVVAVNQSYAIEYVNSRAEELLGKKEEELLGSTLGAFFPGNFTDFKRKLLLPLEKEEFTYLEKIILTSATGEKIAISGSVSRVEAGKRKDQSYIIVFSDITRLEYSLAELREKVAEVAHQNKELGRLGANLQQEKESVERKVLERTRALQEKQAELLASIDSVEVGFLMLDSKLHTKNSNVAAQTLLGIKGDVDAADIARVWPTFMTRVKESMRNRTTVEVNGEKHNELYLNLSISPIIMADEVLGVVILLNNVTEATLIERSKDEFLAIASHELRTPLTAILGYVEMLEELYGKKIVDTQFERILASMRQGGERLLVMIRTFLDVSRMEQGKVEFHLEGVKVGEVIQQSEEEIHSLIAHKDIEFKIDHSIDKLPIVLADKEKIKQVLINLVGNAVKCTEKGSIAISSKLEKEMAVIYVQDSGRGIAHSQQQRLFQKFEQASDHLLRRDTPQSTGLGLYICKLIMQGLGGEVYLEHSELGKGSIFALRIPIYSKKIV